MHKDFPRIITLLRKERNISQKNAANDLGVSQALLSHYEKGIRECGLEFLVKAADYYDVSCDYLLGRSPDPQGKKISYDDIPDHDPMQKETIQVGGMLASFNKKIIINSINILFSLLQKTSNNNLVKSISSYLMLSVYKMFRIVYSINPKNDSNFFVVSDIQSSLEASACMNIDESNSILIAKGLSSEKNEALATLDDLFITASTLSTDYPNQSSSLLNLIKNSETEIMKLYND